MKTAFLSVFLGCSIFFASACVQRNFHAQSSASNVEGAADEVTLFSWTDNSESLPSGASMNMDDFLREQESKFKRAQEFNSQERPVGAGLKAGAGIYFAEDPVTSYIYGNTLWAITLKASSTVKPVPLPGDSYPVIRSPAAAVIDPYMGWFTAMEIVARKPEFFASTVRAARFQRHIPRSPAEYKIPPVEIRNDLFKMIEYHIDYTEEFAKIVDQYTSAQIFRPDFQGEKNGAYKLFDCDGLVDLVDKKRLSHLEPLFVANERVERLRQNQSRWSFCADGSAGRCASLVNSAIARCGEPANQTQPFNAEVLDLLKVTGIVPPQVQVATCADAIVVAKDLRTQVVLPGWKNLCEGMAQVRKLLAPGFASLR